MKTVSKKTISKKIGDAALSLYVNGKTTARRAAAKLREKDGLWSDYALTIVIGVVLAAIVLTALVFLFKDKIFPSLNSKTDEFFAIS